LKGYGASGPSLDFYRDLIAMPWPGFELCQHQQLGTPLFACTLIASYLSHIVQSYISQSNSDCQVATEKAAMFVECGLRKRHSRTANQAKRLTRDDRACLLVGFLPGMLLGSRLQ